MSSQNDSTVQQQTDAGFRGGSIGRLKTTHLGKTTGNIIGLSLNESRKRMHHSVTSSKLNTKLQSRPSENKHEGFSVYNLYKRLRGGTEQNVNAANEDDDENDYKGKSNKQTLRAAKRAFNFYRGPQNVHAAPSTNNMTHAERKQQIIRSHQVVDQARKDARRAAQVTRKVVRAVDSTLAHALIHRHQARFNKTKQYTVAPRHGSRSVGKERKIKKETVRKIVEIGERVVKEAHDLEQNTNDVLKQTVQFAAEQNVTPSKMQHARFTDNFTFIGKFNQQSLLKKKDDIQNDLKNLNLLYEQIQEVRKTEGLQPLDKSEKIEKKVKALNKVNEELKGYQHLDEQDKLDEQMANGTLPLVLNAHASLEENIKIKKDILKRKAYNDHETTALAVIDTLKNVSATQFDPWKKMYQAVNRNMWFFNPMEFYAFSKDIYHGARKALMPDKPYESRADGLIFGASIDENKDNLNPVPKTGAAGPSDIRSLAAQGNHVLHNEAQQNVNMVHGGQRDVSLISEVNVKNSNEGREAFQYKLLNIAVHGAMKNQLDEDEDEIQNAVIAAQKKGISQGETKKSVERVIAGIQMKIDNLTDLVLGKATLNNKMSPFTTNWVRQSLWRYYLQRQFGGITEEQVMNSPARGLTGYHALSTAEQGVKDIFKTAEVVTEIESKYEQQLARLPPAVAQSISKQGVGEYPSSDASTMFHGEPGLLLDRFENSLPPADKDFMSAQINGAMRVFEEHHAKAQQQHHENQQKDLNDHVIEQNQEASAQQEKIEELKEAFQNIRQPAPSQINIYNSPNLGEGGLTPDDLYDQHMTHGDRHVADIVFSHMSAGLGTMPHNYIHSSDSVQFDG